MTYQFEQIKNIILTNPNKNRIAKGREIRERNMMHIHGVGMKDALRKVEDFENDSAYKARKEYAVSNKDFFARLLNEEKQVFTARGGSVNWQLPESLATEMNGLTDDVQYGYSLHKWVETFAYEAYKADPMGVIFMEREQSVVTEDGFIQPKCYPTYKASCDIYDYATNGRRLEHICFQLKAEQLSDYGIKDENYKSAKGITPYFRFVDDASDTIYKQEGSDIVLVIGDIISQANPIRNTWNRVPGFIVSDMMRFDDPECFASSVDTVIELADCFLYDRSIRDLQKKYHGFAKAIEPLLKCGTCAGQGVLNSGPCPDCTPAGAQKGMGYKLRTKISDISKFPIDILKDANFDFKKIFGYVTPDIESWNKQDTSLSDLEQMSYFTYWGVNNTKVSGFNGKQDQEETATKTITNLQPKYARLNHTADWAETTENWIADFIGQFWFENKWKQGKPIRYGRNYILETPEEIIAAYYDMITKGSPDSVKDEQVRKYIRALYQDNPIQEAKFLKLFAVEPFPHNKPADIEASPIVPMLDKLCKRYYGEWVETLEDEQIIYGKEDALRQLLITYATEKEAKLKPELEAAAKEKEKGSFSQN